MSQKAVVFGYNQPTNQPTKTNKQTNKQTRASLVHSYSNLVQETIGFCCTQDERRSTYKTCNGKSYGLDERTQRFAKGLSKLDKGKGCSKLPSYVNEIYNGSSANFSSRNLHVIPTIINTTPNRNKEKINGALESYVLWGCLFSQVG